MKCISGTVQAQWQATLHPRGAAPDWELLLSTGTPFFPLLRNYYHEQILEEIESTDRESLIYSFNCANWSWWSDLQNLQVFEYEYAQAQADLAEKDDGWADGDDLLKCFSAKFMLPAAGHAPSQWLSCIILFLVGSWIIFRLSWQFWKEKKK